MNIDIYVSTNKSQANKEMKIVTTLNIQEAEMLREELNNCLDQLADSKTDAPFTYPERDPDTHSVIE